MWSKESVNFHFKEMKDGVIHSTRGQVRDSGNDVVKKHIEGGDLIGNIKRQAETV